ncbi:MAG: hypothetical protein RIF41_36685 [Polyangiaceae bacterium]
MTWLAVAVTVLALVASCGVRGVTPGAGVDRKASCQVRRAAYDIGSATTKMKVAVVDRCSGSVVRTLASAEEAVFYRRDILRRPARLRDETMERGLRALRRLHDLAGRYQPQEQYGVATAAFRTAENGSRFLERVHRSLGLSVVIITQTEESRLGFLAAVAATRIEPRRAVVWDVGGGSMELTSLDDQGRMTTYDGDLASGQMERYLLDLEGKAPMVSPNPLDESQVERGIAYATEHAQQSVPEPLRAKLLRPDTVVIGIGATRYYADGLDNSDRLVTLAALARGIEMRLGKADVEIGGAYASTAVSDRILLLGYMTGLGIHTVRVTDAGLTDAVLVEATR